MSDFLQHNVDDLKVGTQFWDMHYGLSEFPFAYEHLRLSMDDANESLREALANKGIDAMYVNKMLIVLQIEERIWAAYAYDHHTLGFVIFDPKVRVEHEQV